MNADVIKRIRWPDAERHKASLLEAIAAQRKKGGGRLGVGGTWAGLKTLHDDTRLFPFVDWLRRAARDRMEVNRHLVLEMWALVMRKGDSIDVHDHAMSRYRVRNAWSGVYWLTLPVGSGRLFFPSLIIAGIRIPTETATVKDALEGDGITFPATLKHGVTGHQSTEEWISIAWNVQEGPSS